MKASVKNSKGFLAGNRKEKLWAFSEKERKATKLQKIGSNSFLFMTEQETSPNSNMVEMMKRDIMKVISKYVDISEDELHIAITREQTQGNNMETKLVANIPIKNVKNIGRNM